MFIDLYTHCSLFIDFICLFNSFLLSFLSLIGLLNSFHSIQLVWLGEFSINCYDCNEINIINIRFQDTEQPDDQTNTNGMPKKCEKALLARIWGNFDKK